MSHPVPCAPCYRSRGCEGMECVRLVDVEEVHDVVEKVLRMSYPQRA